MESKDIVRDYIKLYIDEKLNLSSNYLLTAFRNRVDNEENRDRVTEIVNLKEKVDGKIEEVLGDEELNDLKDLSIRKAVIDECYNQLDSDTRTKFKEDLQENLDLAQNLEEPKFDSNLILSEVFITKEQKTGPEAHIEESILQNDDPDAIKGMNIIEFERNLRDYDFNKFNSRKILAFFEMIKNYNFDVDYADGDKEKIEGFLLMCIYNNNQFLNTLIFEDYFVDFMRKFTTKYLEDFESEIDVCKFQQSPHVVLLSSYNKHLCYYLDKKNFFEIIVQYFDDIEKDHLHILMKACINIFTNYSYSIDKAIDTGICNLFAQKMIHQDDIQTVSLFILLLNKIKQFEVVPKKIFMNKERLVLVDNFIKIIDANQELKIFSFKFKNKPSDYRPSSPTEHLLVLNHYCEVTREMINQKMSVRRYKQMYHFVRIFLDCLAKNPKLIPKKHRFYFLGVAVEYVSVYYYQKYVIRAAFDLFRTVINEDTIRFFFEEFFNTHLLNNCFTTFERSVIDEDGADAILSVQRFFLDFLDQLEVYRRYMNEGEVKKFMDILYKIKKAVDEYYYKTKKKYLVKGLVKYINKINNNFKENIINKLDLILSNNSLILKKLSNVHFLEVNMDIYIAGHKGKSLIVVKEDAESQEIDEQRVIKILSNARKIIYFGSKVDRREHYIFKVTTFNLEMLTRIELFVNHIEKNSIQITFDTVERVIEYLIISLSFVKSYDQNYKKETSIQTLAKTVELIISLFSRTKSFVDLHSNSQIYLLLENFNLFWFMYFDFDFDFGDRFTFVFLENLERKTRSDHQNKEENFESTQLHTILNFLNDFVDLKSKDVYINFVIIKQLDLIYNTLSHISKINENYLIKITQKAFSTSFTGDIHKLHPKYMLNFSTNFLSVPDIKEAFMSFVYKNKLYLNFFVIDLTRSFLDKNYDFEELEVQSEYLKTIVKCLVLEQDIPDDPKLTKYILQLAQENIRNKSIFQDVIIVLKRHLKRVSSEYHSNLIKHLFSSANLFEKMIRLYKKEKVNLSRVLKNLLIICKHYDLFTEISIPDYVIKNMLVADEFQKFQDVYTHFINYIIENDKYADFKDEIDIFFVNVKSFLDNVLFFNLKIGYNKNIKAIYYALKILRNCSQLAPKTLNIDVEDFVVKYILQLFEDGKKMDITTKNNLYMHFNDYFQYNENNKEVLKYERKITKLLLNILKSGYNMDGLLTDPLYLNKLLEMSYFIFELYPIETFQDLYIRFIHQGLTIEVSKKKILYSDLYLLMNYSYGLESEEINNMIDKIHIKSKHIQKDLKNIMDKIAETDENPDTASYNNLVRNSLKLFYFISNYEDKLLDKDFLSVIKCLDKVMRSSYEVITKVARLERLYIEMYMLIHKKKNATSVNSALIFFTIFTGAAEFKLSSLVDKYIYMGLFNNYFQRAQHKSQVLLNRDTLEYIKDDKVKRATLIKLEKIKIEKENLNQILLQLNLEEINKNNEIILLKFFQKCYFINRMEVASLDFNSKVVLRKFKEIIEAYEKFDELSPIDLILLKRRMDFVKITFKSFVYADEDNKDKYLENVTKFSNALLEKLNRETNNPNLKKRIDRQIYKRELKLIKKFYYYASNLNETVIKPPLLNCLETIIPSFGERSTSNETDIFKANRSLLLVMKIIRRKYDEVRIAQHEGLVKKITQLFKEEIIVTMEDKIQKSIAEEKMNEEEAENLFKPIPFMRGDDLDSLKEISLFLFVCLTKNSLLLEKPKKNPIFSRIDNYIDKFNIGDLSQFLFDKLEEEFRETGMRYDQADVDENQVANTGSLNMKQKNILYVTKIFITISENLGKNDELTGKEIKYLVFGIMALKKQLMENLDPEIFNKLGLFIILGNMVINESIPIEYKNDLLELMIMFLDKTQEKNSVDPTLTEDFIYFYEQFIFDKYPEIKKNYFEVLEMMFVLIKYEDVVVNEYFDKLNYALFETSTEIVETVFVGCLNSYVAILNHYEVNYDFEKIADILYTFLKINQRNMALQEKTQFSVILAHIDMKIPIDPIKFSNITYFLKFRYKNETLEQFYKSLQIIESISEKYDKYQAYMKRLSFEMVFKAGMKNFGKSKKMVQLLGKLFLKYTYLVDENKFEMFETLKNTLYFIEVFYKAEMKEAVFILYKCLINASLAKKNAEYMLKINLDDTILNYFYKYDFDFYYLVLCLLFNLCFILEKEDGNINDVMTNKILTLIITIFDDALEKRNETVLNEIIDLFISFIQHNNLQFFTLRIVKRIKLTLNFYYETPEVIIKFLTIIKDIIIMGSTAILDMLVDNFDLVYLYHIHFRNIKNQKINALIKTIIHNLLECRKDTLKEDDLVTYGIPENIIHSFSLEDPHNVMIVNLKIIALSSKYEKCLFFIKNHFICSMKIILFHEEREFNDEVVYYCLDVLVALYGYFKDMELLRSQFYFINIKKLVDMIAFYKDNEDYLLVLIKIVQHGIADDQEVLNDFDNDMIDVFNGILERRDKISNKEIVTDVYQILNNLNIQQSFKNKKAPLALNDGNLTIEDREFLTIGIPLVAMFADKLHKGAILKYNFIKKKLVLFNVFYHDKFKDKHKKRTSILSKRLEDIDSITDKDREYLDNFFKSYFKKTIRRELYTSIKFWTFHKGNFYMRDIFLIFDNEFKCRKFKDLMQDLRSIL